MSAADRERLHRAITGVLDYRQHVTGCEITQTDFCSCGLREAIERLDSEWKSHASQLSALSEALSAANEEIAQLKATTTRTYKCGVCFEILPVGGKHHHRTAETELVELETATLTNPKKPDVRAIIETLGFDPTNHHNARACPYCNPNRLTAEAEQATAKDREVARLAEALTACQQERDSAVIEARKAQQKLEHRTLSMQDVVRSRDEWHARFCAVSEEVMSVQADLTACRAQGEAMRAQLTEKEQK